MISINHNIQLFEYDQIKCPPDWFVQESGCLYHRLYYVYRGKVSYESSNRTVQLKENHLYLFPIYRPYQINHEQNNSLECLWFHLAHFPPILNKLVEIKINKDEFFHILKSLEIMNNNAEKEIIVQTLELMFSLLEKKVDFKLENDARIKKALKYIHDNYDRKITNKQLAVQVSLNKHYFIRLFKNKLGITPYKYINNYRMNKASYLLVNKEDVKTVAHTVGYEDEKAFSRSFKKIKGVPPSQYKKWKYLNP